MMNPRLIRLCVTSVAAVFVMAACSSGGSESRKPPADPEAYSLGETHAREFLDCAGDTAVMCVCLLDVRTRETDFRRRLGDEAADSYVDGFVNYITDNDPKLAASIF